MANCTVTDCSRPAHAKGLCSTHYALWRKNGDPTQKTGRWDGHVKVDKVCAVDGCEKPSRRATYCPMHGKRIRLYGSPDAVQPRGGLNRSTAESFWSRVAGKPSDCWEFPGARDSWGYGVLTFQGKQWKANRLAFYLTHGQLPEPMALHHCDNPPCCNPSHLYEGDGSQNMTDMYTRGRGNRPTGTAHHTVHYSDGQAADIAVAYRQLRDESLSRGLTKTARGAVQSLADEFGVSVDTVRRIARRT